MKRAAAFRALQDGESRLFTCPAIHRLGDEPEALVLGGIEYVYSTRIGCGECSTRRLAGDEVREFHSMLSAVAEAGRPPGWSNTGRSRTPAAASRTPASRARTARHMNGFEGLMSTNCARGGQVQANAQVHMPADEGDSRPRRKGRAQSQPVRGGHHLYGRRANQQQHLRRRHGSRR